MDENIHTSVPLWEEVWETCLKIRPKTQNQEVFISKEFRPGDRINHLSIIIYHWQTSTDRSRSDQLDKPYNIVKLLCHEYGSLIQEILSSSDVTDASRIYTNQPPLLFLSKLSTRTSSHNTSVKHAYGSHCWCWQLFIGCRMVCNLLETVFFQM